MDESVKEQIKIGDLAEDIRREYGISSKDPKQYSPLTLAYIGDGIYDLVIRTIVVEQGNARVNQLHKYVSSIVKAGAQAQVVREIEPLLTEEEMGIYRRGRNAKSYTMAKNASVVEYRMATGLEALMGYLYLLGRMDRILELIEAGLSDSAVLHRNKKGENNHA